MAAQRFEFPLPERVLPRVRVSPEQHEELRAFAVRTALEVLRDGPSWGRSNVKAARERGWKVSQRSPDVCFMMKTTTTSRPTKVVKSNRPQLSQTTSMSSDDSPLGALPEDAPGHRAKRGIGGAGGRAFMGSVRLAGYNLDDVVASIHCETTRAQRQQVSNSYGNAYLDCCILQTLEGAKPFDPFWYIGLKWTALKSPFEKLVNHREFVYLEHTGTHVNAQGHRMLYRIIQSISLDEFGGEQAYFGLTRAHLEAAYVYWMDGPGYLMPSGPDESAGILTVCMKGLAHPKGKVPLWLVERYMKRFWKAGWSLKGSGVDAPLDDERQITLDLATEWVADSERKACALCQKRFRFGRRMRHHCRACGEVICRNCTQYFLLTYPTAASVGAYPVRPSSNRSYNRTSSTPSSKLPFGEEDDQPATLGGNFDSDSRGRMRGASENDAAMVGKVCRRCVENKKVAIRRETQLSAKGRSSRRGTQALSWENGAKGLQAQPIHESDEHDEDQGLPIMGHDEESDAEYFVPETPGPNMNEQQYYHHHHQQHFHDNDDTASEFSIGDFETSNFKPYTTLDFKGANAVPENRTGTSLDSQFAQSGFSVGINAHDDESDDEAVGYHSDPDHDVVRHPQVGKIAHMTVQEERFTMSSDRKTAAKLPPPPPVAQNFVLTAQALNEVRYSKHDARLRLEDLLADTDDEGEADYSTSPPLRPSALTSLDVHELRPQPHLTRTGSAPPVALTRDRLAPPPPPPVGRYRVSSATHRDSNMSSVSFSSFDADMLVDAAAFEDDFRMSTTIDGDEEDEDALIARIQHIQDEAMRRHLLASPASSVASSLSESVGPAMRFQRNARAPSNGLPLANNGTSLSEASTISSNGSFGSAPTTETQPKGKSQKAMQLRVESAIADQAELLYQIQMERERSTDVQHGIKLY